MSPTDERTDEMILPCTVTDPVMAHAVLNDLVPGDKLRVTGYLRLPRTRDGPVGLDVARLEILQSAPLLAGAPFVDTLALERYGPYVCVFDIY